jgi:hypothetical protein
VRFDEADAAGRNFCFAPVGQQKVVLVGLFIQIKFGHAAEFSAIAQGNIVTGFASHQENRAGE